MTHLIEDLQSFLNVSPTAWHAVSEIGNRLALKEFSPLSEKEKWSLELGKKYFVVREGSLCAFALPTEEPRQAIILASHTDSPGLQIKPHPEIRKGNMLLLNTSIYGSPLLSSWLNRDLGIAGRVVIKSHEGAIEEKLVMIDDAPLIIPQLSPHLSRELSEKGLIIDKQEHLLPLLGLDEGSDEKGFLEKLIRRHLSFHSLMSFDLFLVPLEESRFLGFQGELLASWRIDNLVSAHASIAALVSAPSLKDKLQITLLWNHEEIGSRSSEGASSPFFSDIMKRISVSLKIQEEQQLQLKANSYCISLDMAQGYSPHHASKFDLSHPCFLGRGVAIKYNSDLKYNSNAVTAAPIIQACKELDLPYQNFYNRNDVPSGSTVGPIFSALTGIPTVDIGIPQLSMHSIREVMAVSDYLGLCRLLTHLLTREA